METLRKLLDVECDYRMSDETMDMFVNNIMTEAIELKNKQALVPYGKFDNNIYIIKEGIMRYVYFDGLKEMTLAFGSPGTLMISYHSFYQGIPTFFSMESCGNSVVMKVPKAEFDDLCRQSTDFQTWVLRAFTYQLFMWEKKAAVVNGTPKERFESLIKNRPDILKRVSNKAIASYIGIDESYLSYLKRDILSKGKK